MPDSPACTCSSSRWRCRAPRQSADCRAARQNNPGPAGRELVRNDPATGKKEVLVPAQALVPGGAKEPLAVDAYALSADESRVLISTNSERVWRRDTRGDYWVLDVATRKLRKLGGDASPSSLMFAAFSPDGTRVAYVRENNLYVQDVNSLQVTALTADGSKTLINGTSDWVNEEELDLRDCFRWSPDGRHVLFWQFDTAGVAEFHLVDNVVSKSPRITSFAYPKVGEKNSATRLGVVPAGGEVDDAAFLRRVRYKLEVSRPDTAQFTDIFRSECQKKSVPFDAGKVDYLVKRHYESVYEENRQACEYDIERMIVDDDTIPNAVKDVRSILADLAADAADARCDASERARQRDGGASPQAALAAEHGGVGEGIAFEAGEDRFREGFRDVAEGRAPLVGGALRVDADDAVAVRLLVGDRHDRDDRAVGLVVGVHQLPDAGPLAHHDVIREDHGERLVADELLRDEDGMAETERLALPDVREVNQVGDLPDFFELRAFAPGFEKRLEFDRDVKVVLDGVFAAARHENDVRNPRGNRFLDAVLDDRLVDQRQHFLRLGLGGRQEAGAESGDGQDGLAKRFGHDGNSPGVDGDRL